MQLDNQFSLIEEKILKQLNIDVDEKTLKKVREKVKKELKNDVSTILNQYRGGNLWSSWYSYISFFRDVCNWENEVLEKYNVDEQIALNAGWVFYHDLFAIVCEFPQKLDKIEQGLHCDNGPAIEYKDGWKIWSIDGVVVDEKTVLRPHELTLQDINNESNEEVRRIKIERFGWEKYLKEAGTLIEERFNERDLQIEKLYQVGQIKRMILTDPSTGRKYSQGVPNDIKTCEEGQNWMNHGLESRAIHRS